MSMAFFKPLICSTGSGDISHTKLWTNIAYLAATVAFIRANWHSVAPADIWLYYLGGVGGHGVLSKLISLKYGGKDEGKD